MKDKCEGDADLDWKTDRGRVQLAIQVYLLVFLGMNLLVWSGWFLHGRPSSYFPLGDLTQRFGDLVRFSGKYQIGKVPHMLDLEGLAGTLFPRNYPPFAAVIYVILLQMCAPYALVLLLAAELGAVLAACFSVWRSVRGLAGYRWYVGVAIFGTGLFGWGTLQVVMRGNIEGVVWIGVCLGAALYARKDYLGAGLAFGVSCCVKPYSVLWLALMARHRKYREAALGLFAAAAVTMMSMVLINPNPVKAYHIVYAKSFFFENYIVSLRPMEEMKGDHSLLQSMKTIARVVRNHGFNLPAKEYGFTQPNDPLAWKLYHVCLPLSAALGLVVLWRVWNKPVLNQMFALACVSTVLPLIAADYTLIVLLVPMGFFVMFLLEDVAQGRAAMSLGQMLWFVLPCAWLMATEPMWLLHGVLKCIAVLVLLGASVVVPMPSTVFGETSDGTAMRQVQSSHPI